jgi:Cu(I)/Ag(I) efflux system protein CusF
VAKQGLRAWFSAGALALALCGCSKQSPSAPPPSATPAEPSVAAPAANDHPHGVGVVQSIDAAAGTVTISHQPIESIGWPAMTMPFKVAKPELLQHVAAGDKVEFTLDGKDMSASITSLTEAH